jgi:hypothetical protein
VAIEKRPGLVEVALQRQRDDDGAPCAADAQREPTRARMTANFELRTNVLETDRSRLRRQLGDLPSIFDPHALCPPKLARITLMQ